MTSFRTGNYLSRNTFQDRLKFIKNDKTCFNIERIRRQTTGSLFRKFIKYERNYLSLNFIDENNHQLGGRLTVATNEWNFSQLASHTYNQYGYFTDDKFVFGKYDINLTADNVENTSVFDEIITSSINSSNIVIRHNYEIIDGILQYRMEINPNLIDKYHEDLTSPNDENTVESELVPRLPLSATERFFIQLGLNK